MEFGYNSTFGYIILINGKYIIDFSCSNCDRSSLMPAMSVLGFSQNPKMPRAVEGLAAEALYGVRDWISGGSENFQAFSWKSSC